MKLHGITTACVLLAVTPFIAQAELDSAGNWHVERGDTLYNIARRIAPNSAQEQARLRKHILDLNPSAFKDGDPGALEKGRTISLSQGRTTAKQHAPMASVAEQRAALAHNTKGKGFGPQSPRDIDALAGKNKRLFSSAPAFTAMNLCNIHFHKNAEHKGGEFTQYAGAGDGHGFQTGYKYSGQLSTSELQPTSHSICPSKHGALSAGDTIEVHYVHTTAQVKPGPTLGACLSDSIKNPQLRVETQVYALVNDKNALDFQQLTQHGIQSGLHQALNIPVNTGKPIQYAGSTTGPSYNEKGSPFQVTWSVRPKVAKVNIESVGQWCKGNTFAEDHAHGVRNLVTNPDLLSPIQP